MKSRIEEPPTIQELVRRGHLRYGMFEVVKVTNIREKDIIIGSPDNFRFKTATFEIRGLTPLIVHRFVKHNSMYRSDVIRSDIIL